MNRVAQLDSGGFILTHSCVVGDVVGRSGFFIGVEFSHCKGSQEMCCWDNVLE